MVNIGSLVCMTCPTLLGSACNRSAGAGACLRGVMSPWPHRGLQICGVLFLHVLDALSSESAGLSLIVTPRLLGSFIGSTVSAVDSPHLTASFWVSG